MFSEREQAFLQAIAISALEVSQQDDFKLLKPQEITAAFEEYLSDYFYHKPLSECEDQQVLLAWKTLSGSAPVKEFPRIRLW